MYRCVAAASRLHRAPPAAAATVAAGRRTTRLAALSSECLNYRSCSSVSVALCFFTMSQQKQVLANLFGSDSDDDAPPPAAAAAAAPLQLALVQPAAEERLDEEEGEEEDGRRERAAAVGPPLLLDCALPPQPPPGHVCVLLRPSNVCSFAAAPFDPASHALEGALQEGEVRPLDGNVVRWRFGPDGVPQSNARLVRWSDGSLQLQLGEEVLDCAAVDVSRDNGHLFARTPAPANILAAQGALGVRLTLRPSTLDSKSHKLLAASAAARHAKVTRVKKMLTERDPEAEKAEMEKAELGRVKAAEAMARKRAATEQRYALEAGEGALSKSFLEGAEDELEEGQGAAEAARAVGRKRKAAAAKPGRKRVTMLSSDEEDGGGDWSEGGEDD